MSFIYENVRKGVIKDLAESGAPSAYLYMLEKVIQDIRDEDLSEEDIRTEAWGEETEDGE